ncbi:MAG: hypothetical protein SGCHY_003490 [Lobulomycetales sp.]
MSTDKAGDFLSSQAKSASGALKTFFTTAEGLYDKKLWHELTRLLLDQLLALPEARPKLHAIYENFVSPWAQKMKPLSRVKIAIATAATLPSPTEARAFLAPIVESLKSSKDDVDAYILANIEEAHYALLAKDLPACLATITECEPKREALNAPDPATNANFYRVSADYYKATADYPLYYHNALLYLSSVSDLSQIPLAIQQERAGDLALSALLGDGLYTFGHLLMHPILSTLKGTPNEYLVELLVAFNRGDMDTFNGIKSSKNFNGQPLLVAAQTFLQQKLCIMTLIQAVFSRNKDARGHILFADISRECRVALDEVEHLVMKAFSLKVLRGRIDQIDQVVHVEWVQPRVLDTSQIASLKDMLDEWVGKVHAQVSQLKDLEGAQEVFVQ